MVPGENPGDWGDKTNTNLRGIEEAICQTNNVTFAGTATVALSITDFTDPPQIGRGFRLNLTGTGTAGQILQVPDIQKSYIINNGLAVDTTVKNSTSSPTVLVPAGKSAFVYSLNSAGVTNAITTLPSANISGTFEISGNASVGGTLNIGNTTTSKSISADGTLNVGSNASVTGTLGVTGNTNVSNLTASGTLNVGTNASVTGTLGVTGDTDLANLSASGTFDVAGNASVGGTLKVTGAVTAASTLNVGSNVSVGGTLGVTGDVDVANLSASGTFDVGGNASVGGTLGVKGDTDVANLSASGTFDVAGNASVGGTHTVTGYYKNSSGNLIIEPATYIAEIRGGGSTDAELKLNCRSNSHGQTIKAQEHSAAVTNTMLLPKGANSTLVSEVADQELSFKKMGALLREHSKINTNATTGTINFSAREQNVVLRTTNASGNFVLNIRGNASTSLNNSMETEESISIAFEVKQGSTAYYMTALQIDGSTVSPVYWQGGTAPSEGTADGIDSYVINITKTGDATFTVLASLTAFGSVS